MIYGVVTFSASKKRKKKRKEEEVNLVQNVVPKSTQYKSKWAHGIFKEWQRQRLVNKSSHCRGRWFIQKLRFSSSWVVGNSSGVYESVVSELSAYEICPRGGKAFKRALPSDNLVRRHSCWYSSLSRREETGWEMQIHWVHLTRGMSWWSVSTEARA